MTCKYKVKIKDIQYNYKVQMTDIQSKYKFKVFCTGYDDSEIKDKIDAMYEAWPKVSGTGETITLNDTANTTMAIDLKGNTSQETTTGQNLYDYTDIYQVSSGITTDNDGWITCTYDNSSSSSIAYKNYYTNKLNLQTSTDYLVVVEVKNVSGNGRLVPTSSSPAGQFSTTSKYFSNMANNTTYTFIPKTSDNFDSAVISLRSFIQFDGGESGSITFRMSLLANTSITPSTFSYEPYTNGASPNPSYPQDIHVVSGDNSINVCGKNLLSNDITGSISWGSTSVTYNGSAIKVSKSETNGISANAHTNIRYFPLTTGKTYTFSMNYKSGTIITEGASYGWGFYIYGVNKDGSTSNSTGYRWTCDLPKTTTMPSNHITFTPDKDFIGFKLGCYISGASLKTDGDVYFDCQVEVGEATTYEPYQSQSYPINLGDIELCKIGDYQDSIVKDNGKWYLNKKIGKLVLDGTQNITLASSGTRRFNATYTTLGISNVKEGTSAENTTLNYRMNDHFIYSAGQNTWGRYYLYNNWLVMLDSGSTIASANDLKIWLGNNNTSIYYVLATPTYTEITDSTLISQLEAIAEAESYSGQTNISQTNSDKPFIITAKALKDLSSL